MALAATLASLGGSLEPPVLPARPASWPSSFCIVPAAGGPGFDGAAPALGMTTAKPGRVIVCVMLAAVTRSASP
jgi:hypothetical protein